MKYLKQYKEPNAQIIEVTYDEALHSVLGSYQDNEMTREMMEQEGEIPCMFCTITVVKE